MHPTNNGIVTRLQPDRNAHGSRDDCPCRACRHGRRRASDLPLDPSLVEEANQDAESALEAFGFWLAAAALVAVLVGALAWVLGA
jgi:hypothetical protein